MTTIVPVRVKTQVWALLNCKLIITNCIDFVFPVIQMVTTKNKGKAVPLQAWSGPQGSRNLRFPDYMTTAQDGGKVVSLTHRPPLPPGNAPGTRCC
jgi:hypothetical protein